MLLGPSTVEAPMPPALQACARGCWELLLDLLGVEVDDDDCDVIRPYILGEPCPPSCLYQLLGGLIGILTGGNNVARLLRGDELPQAISRDQQNLIPVLNCVLCHLQKGKRPSELLAPPPRRNTTLGFVRCVPRVEL